MFFSSILFPTGKRGDDRTENHNFDKEFFAMKRLCLKLVLAMLFFTFLSVGNSEAQGLPDFSYGIQLTGR